VIISDTDVTTVRYTVHNNSKKSHRLVLSITTPVGISQSGEPCVLAAKSADNPDPTCILTLNINGHALPANILMGGPSLCQANRNGTPNTHQCYEPNAKEVLMITRTTQPGATTLTTSIAPSAILALSVNKPSLNLALAGKARHLTIRNTGTNVATGLTITYPTWPGGTPATTASSTCQATLAAGDSCTITITPGANATSNCDTGTAPKPGTITVSATNVATTVTSQVVVLSYGCQYQGGLLYAVDDTTANTGSIGGTVLSLQNLGPSSGITWSPNEQGRVDYTDIPGIYEDSKTSSSSLTKPFYGSADTSCNGASDGACDSNKILSYYKASTSNTFYAASLCTPTINSYSGWYLPAICELDAVISGTSEYVNCPSGTQDIVESLSFLIGDPDIPCTAPNGIDCLVGSYWSSTEYSDYPNSFAWAESFFASIPSFRGGADKESQYGVRCSRALTL
jgi:hypothetical protein